jgi:hypothetical protein
MLQRDSDLQYWNGSVWVASAMIPVSAGFYDAGTGLFRYNWTPLAYGQYSCILILSSPHFYDAVDIEVEQIQFYESEDQS